MKKIYSILLSLLILGFTFAETFPPFPMTIYGEIKIGDLLPEEGTINIYNSLDQELATYEITEIGKYGSDHVQILPLLLNQFEGTLDIKLNYNGKTYIVDQINDSYKGENCPSGSSINFASANCRYDITFKEDNSNNNQGGGSNEGTGNNSGGHGGSSRNKGKNIINKDSTTTGTQNNISSESNDNINTETHSSADEGNNDNQNYNNEYPNEFNEAYQFAHKYGITTKDDIYEADMEGYLTRIATAKMLSYYAMNVLGKKPDISKGMVRFNDVTNQMNALYDNAVTLAYQLGIMGQNIKNNNFRPNDKLTRAEFTTALSRMLYEIEDGTGNINYYEPHMAKLYNDGIINKRDSKMQEIRGYAMIMLMRTEKNKINKK